VESERVKQLALALGFDLVGVAPARPTQETEYLSEWIARGYAGEMTYLARRLAERIDPRRVLAGAESIIAVGLVYDPGERAPLSGAAADIARYAGGEDYHDVLRERLRALRAALEAAGERPLRSRIYVDTGPVQERVHAAYAGLGWIGKNTCLIHPRLGSYVFLGAMLTDWPLTCDDPLPDHCGSCRACLDACPTDAFVAPYVLDATRCIAYTTIEARGAIPEELRESHGERVFGCDVCQEVCPWNRRRGRRVPPDRLGLRARLRPRKEWIAPTLAWLLGLDEEAWERAVRKTALRRARRQGMLRNALVAAGNSGAVELIPLVEKHVAASDSLLAEHARWALARLRSVTEVRPAGAARSPARVVPENP